MADINWSELISSAEQFVTTDNDKAGKQLAERITLAERAWAKLSPVWDACHNARLAANPKVKATTVANFQEWAVKEARGAGERWLIPLQTVTAIAAMRFHSTEARAAFSKWCNEEPERRNENIESYRKWLPSWDRGDWTRNGKPSTKRTQRINKSEARRATKLATLVEVNGSDITFGRVVVGSKFKFGLTTLELLRHNLDVTIAQIEAKLSETEIREAKAEAEATIRKTLPKLV